MPHNHTNKYSCHWAHRRLCCQNKHKIILLFQTKFNIIFCQYFLSLLCLFIHQGHQPLLLPCASFHISCKNCCWGYNLEAAESLVFGGVLETQTWRIHSLLNPPPLLVLTTTLQPPSKSSPPTEECVLYPQLNEIC